VLLTDRHDGLKNGKQGKIAMSLTTILCLPSFSRSCRTRLRFSKGEHDELKP
jgi:hypothetical protein